MCCCLPGPGTYSAGAHFYLEGPLANSSLSTQVSLWKELDAENHCFLLPSSPPGGYHVFHLCSKFQVCSSRVQFLFLLIFSGLVTQWSWLWISWMWIVSKDWISLLAPNRFWNPVTLMVCLFTQVAIGSQKEKWPESRIQSKYLWLPRELWLHELCPHGSILPSKEDVTVLFSYRLLYFTGNFHILPTSNHIRFGSKLYKENAMMIFWLEINLYYSCNSICWALCRIMEINWVVNNLYLSVTITTYAEGSISECTWDVFTWKKLKQCSREILVLGLIKPYFVKPYCLNDYIQKDTLFIASK